MPRVQEVHWGSVEPENGSSRFAPSSSGGWPIRALLLALAVVLSAGLGAGCKRAKTGEGKVPTVTVSLPDPKMVTDFVDFTGRTESVEAVDIYPYQVSGYLERLDFPYTEGAIVQKGQLLFQIEPHLYQAQLDKARYQDRVNEASLNLARVVLKNANDANARVPNTVSAQEVAQDEAAVRSAEATLEASQSNTRVQQKTLDYTKVYAPITGQISRYYYTPGNLVTSQTKLTTILSVDPMYVYFDVDEPTLQRVIRVVNDERQAALQADPEFRARSLLAQKFPLLGRLLVRDVKLPVQMAVPGDMGPPPPPGTASPGDRKPRPANAPDEDHWYNGTLDFINNQVNSGTGSISMRGIFANPEPEIVPGVKGTRLLKPGMFVRVRLPIGKEHPALLIDDKAIGSDQGKKFVWLVVKSKDKDGKEVDVAQKRIITTGQLQKGGMREIRDGLTREDRVIIEGSLKAEEGKPVNAVPPRQRKPDDGTPPTDHKTPDSAARPATRPEGGAR